MCGRGQFSWILVMGCAGIVTDRKKTDVYVSEGAHHHRHHHHHHYDHDRIGKRGSKRSLVLYTCSFLLLHITLIPNGLTACIYIVHSGRKYGE